MPIGRRSIQRALGTFRRSVPCGPSLIGDAERTTAPSLFLELILLDEPDQVAARDLELLGGAGLVAAVAAHRRADHPALERLDRRGQRAGVGTRGSVVGRRELADARRQQSTRRSPARRRRARRAARSRSRARARCRATDTPSICARQSGGEPLRPAVAAVAREEVLDQQRDVVAALAQRRAASR